MFSFNFFHGWAMESAMMISERIFFCFFHVVIFSSFFVGSSRSLTRGYIVLIFVCITTLETLKILDEYRYTLDVAPLTVIVTTRIITFSVGNPCN